MKLKSTTWNGMRSTAAGLAAVFLYVGNASAYSGEDLLDGSPWHHADITCRALTGDRTCRGAGNQVIYNDSLGFNANAVHAIAWHADYIDSYLYSPLWWAAAARGSRPVRSVRHRYLAGMANYQALASLHFDDLNSTPEIKATWERYLSGTLVGLEWAAQEGDVQAAYNIMGLSLHAVQDFYSHSTWINNPSRRDITYLDSTPTARDSAGLMTGAYEQKNGPIQHGAYSFSCTAFTQDPLKTLLKVPCTSPMPTANLTLCERMHECELEPTSTAGVIIGGNDTNYVVLAPPGIAMDNTSLSRIGAHMRMLTEEHGVAAPSAKIAEIMRRAGIDITNARTDIPRSGMLSESARQALLNRTQSSAPPRSSAAAQINARENCSAIIGHHKPCERESDYLFAEGKHLAVTTSQQWIRLIDSYMSMRHAAYWQQVKTCQGCAGRFNYKNPPDLITDQFEDYQKFPFQFIAAGQNAPLQRNDPAAYYLRVELDTATVQGAGTSADIYIESDSGERYLLDYLSMTDVHSPVRGLFTYDDMESGDKQVYTVGPFRTLPKRITFFNDSSTTREVRKAFFSAAGRKIEGAFEGARIFFRNQQDYVGVMPWLAGRDQLDEVIARGGRSTYRGREFQAPVGYQYLFIDGGAEGVYRFDVKITKTDWRGDGAYRRWNEYEFLIDNIHTVKESRVDGGSSHDEPFFFAGLSSYGLSSTEYQKYGPFSGIDSGENIDVNARFARIRLPSSGQFAFAVEAHESDSERQSDRDALYTKFKGELSHEDMADYPEFINEWGRNLGGDWKLANIRVYGFRLGDKPEYGRMYKGTPNVWIDEEARVAFDLDAGSVRPLRASIRDVMAGQSLVSPISDTLMIAPPISVPFYPQKKKEEPAKPEPVKPMQVKPVIPNKTIPLKKPIPIKRF